MTHSELLLVTEREAARILKVSRSFLAQSRMNGTLRNYTPGPPWVRVGRAIRYDLRDLEDWVRENRESPRPALA